MTRPTTYRIRRIGTNPIGKDVDLQVTEFTMVNWAERYFAKCVPDAKSRVVFERRDAGKRKWNLIKFIDRKGDPAIEGAWHRETCGDPACGCQVAS